MALSIASWTRCRWMASFTFAITWPAKIAARFVRPRSRGEEAGREMNRDSSFPGVEVSPLGDLHTSPPTASAVVHPPALPATVPADELSARVRDDNGPAVASGPGARGAASVWVLPAAKLVGFCCVLTCIAWLGERSRDTTVYGPELAESPSPEPALPKPAPA